MEGVEYTDAALEVGNVLVAVVVRIAANSCRSSIVCNSAFSKGSDSASNSEKFMFKGFVTTGLLLRFWLSGSVEVGKMFEEFSFEVGKTWWYTFGGSEIQKENEL